MAISVNASNLVYSGNTAGATTHAIAFPVDVTAGSLCVVLVHRYNGDNSVSALSAGDLTKTAGTSTIGTVALDKAQTLTDGTPHYSDGIFSFIVTGSGSLTMTLAGPTGSFYCLTALEALGTWDGTRLENTASNQNTTASSPFDSTNLTSAGAALFVGMLGTDGSGTLTLTHATSFGVAGVQVGEFQDASARLTGNAAYWLVASGQTDAAEWTATGTVATILATAAVYREPTGGGGDTRARLIGSDLFNPGLVGGNLVQ